MARRKKKETKKFIDKVLKMYYEECKGSPTIAKELDTYSSRIVRIIREHGDGTRDRSEAQSAYLNNTDNHPTKGKTRPVSVKKKISNSVHETWSNKPEHEKEELREKMREIWNSQSPEVHKQRREAAHKAIRQASIEGSRIEQYVLLALRDLGYHVDFHRKNIVPNEELELDLFLPGLKTVVEIDGPTHFQPIWGEEKLRKNQESDRQKSGLVLAAGYCMIRVKYDIKYWSEVQAQVIVEQIVEVLEGISKKFPKKEDRYIEIEALN